MTTIACDGKSMAGDGLVNAGGMITDHAAQKVFRLDDGRLVGVCGVLSGALPFTAWLMAPDTAKPKLDDDFAALVLAPNGELRWYESDLNFTPQTAPMAIGSGSRFALAAMDVGESPESAVVRAAYRDTGTGGTITVLHLKPQLEAVDAA